MATDPVRTDYANEKQDVTYVEHAPTPTDSSLELQKEMTLTGVDMNNTHALKGDDSDGKVEWTLRSIFAAIFLAALYTGMNRLQPRMVFNLTLVRFSGHSLLHWRLSWIHRRRSCPFPRFCVATNSQYSCDCCCLPVCWISPGSLRKASHRSVRLALYLCWLCSGRHWTLLRSATCWHGHLWCWCSVRDPISSDSRHMLTSLCSTGELTGLAG